ncbi:MAG: histidine kinase [Bacteroidetes bacterium]|nr:histidine kinase [Bacteroidota bacterium]
MNKNGPVIVIEDDQDDQDLLKEIFARLNYKNEVVFFADGNAALDYLNMNDVLPFLILSDINMPKINGMELRSKINTNEKLHIKCIPYLFFTTNANKESVIEAYSMAVQGFFVKPNNIKGLENSIRKIMEYWSECIAPSEYL